MGRAQPRGNDAFTYKDTSRIEDAISTLCNRVKCTLKTPTITYREMLQLIAPPEHVDFLLRVREIADVGRYGGRDSGQLKIASHKGKDVSVEFSVTGYEGTPAMPNGPLWLNHFPENRALAVELERCSREYADVAIEWGLVKTVFKYLNKHCKTVAQVRYLWPSVLGIMSVKDDLDGLRRELTPLMVPRNLPSLPQEVRALCRQTSAIVATALLLPPLEEEPTAPKDVAITFNVDSSASHIVSAPRGYEVFTYPIN